MKDLSVHTGFTPHYQPISSTTVKINLVCTCFSSGSGVHVFSLNFKVRVNWRAYLLALKRYQTADLETKQAELVVPSLSYERNHP